MKNITVFLALVLLLAAPQFANAQSAGDVMNKMPPQQRTGYLVGLMHMHSYYAVLANNRKRAKCIIAASKDDAVINRILRAFDRWPDKPPEGLIILIMNKACPK